MASPVFLFNGGSPGVKLSIAASGAVTATLASTVGVRSCSWRISKTDDTTQPSDYALAVSGSVGQTCATTALGAGTAATLECTINGGIDPSTEGASAAMTAIGKFFVPTADGLEVLTAGELSTDDLEASPTHGAVVAINAAIRAENAIVGDFADGGNTFGHDAALGTKDAHDLKVITANTERGRWLSGGDLRLGVKGSASGSLEVASLDANITDGVNVDDVAFPGDAGTTHADRLFRTWRHNLNTGGNLINANRPGAQRVGEGEYVTASAPFTVTAASNASPIVVTVSDVITGLVNGEAVYIEGVLGNTAANGFWKVKNKNNGAKTFELWNWNVGGADTASTGNGAWTSGGKVVYRITMEEYIAYLAPGSNNQDRPIGSTFNGRGDWTSDVTLAASGALAMTSGLASSYSTIAGAISINGFAGINLEVNGASLLDAGISAAGTVTVPNGIHLVAAAGGSGNLDWSASNGFAALPTGNITWAAANGKQMTLSGGNTTLLRIASGLGWQVDNGGAGTDGFKLTRLGAKSWALDFTGTPVDTGSLAIGNANIVNVTIAGSLSQSAGSGNVSLPCQSNGTWLGGNTSGSASMTLDAGTGAIQLGHSASARTWNIGDGNAIQTVNFFNHATPVNLITIGGAASRLGFYGHATVALQTGVAVTAAGIHAACVALGLFTA